MKKPAIVLIGILAVVAIAFSAATILDILPNKTETEPVTITTPTIDDVELHGPYSVSRVIDGDTLIVDIEGTDTRVRLIGVDTPESVHTDESKNTPEGIVASDYTKEALENQKVYLEYDVDKTDDYDRILAYVYVNDTGSMFNAQLLIDGMATTMTIQPNSKYADYFASLQITARENKVGFWENVD